MTIDSTQLTFILDNTPAQQNIMLVGKHGIGKSRILEDYYSKKGCKVVTLFLGQMADPGDLIGLPEKNEKTGKTDFMLPYWFPVDGKPVVLFLDELNRARPEVLQTIMDLTLNRKLAGKVLPEGSRIISAVNNGSEYQLTDLDPALVSRFNIYEFAPSVADWLCWAEKAGTDSRIIEFIRANPEFLDGEDFSSEMDGLERTPDRRSWERASQIISNFENIGKNELCLLSGILGNKASSLFCKFVNEKKLPSANEILTAGYEKFKQIEGTLSQASLPELAELNAGILRCLNSLAKNNADFEMPDVRENLEKYFDFLKISRGKEAVSHFISLLDAQKYPDALNFISQQCSSLYRRILQETED